MNSAIEPIESPVPMARGRARALGLGIVMILGAGCSAVEPDRELERASTWVSERTSHDVDWVATPNAIETDREPGTPWTRWEVARVALHEHPTVRREIARITQACAEQREAGLWPRLVLSGMFGIPIDGAGGDPLVGALVGSIADLWRRPARLSAAQTEVRRRTLLLGDLGLRLAADTQIRGARQLAAARRLELDRRALEQAEERLAIARASFARGELDEAQLIEYEIARARAEDQLDRTRETLRTAQASLRESVGREVALDGASWPTFEVLVGWTATGEEAAERAVDSRLDVQAAFASVDTAEARERLARLSRVPDLRVGVGYERNFSDREGIFPRGEIALPTFDLGQAAVDQAAAMERIASADAQMVVRSALLEVQVAHAAFVSARARAERWREVEWPASRRRLEIARAVHAAGESSRLEWLAAELTGIADERLQSDLLLELHERYFELERALGGRWTEGGDAEEGGDHGGS